MKKNRLFVYFIFSFFNMKFIRKYLNHSKISNNFDYTYKFAQATKYIRRKMENFTTTYKTDHDFLRIYQDALKYSNLQLHE
jgi:hypothetical protein